jgi:hypothetical protein
MRHRVRQFRDASALPTQSDFGLAGEWLPPELFALFDGQHPRDIVHSAATARWLLTRGHDDPDLIGAALLHDVGKGPQRRFDRVAWVVLSAAGVARAVAAPESRLEFRRALHRTREHSAVGARMLASAGASPRLVELTLFHHESRADDPVLALLQQADSAS